jgi:hypothetical protein
VGTKYEWKSLSLAQRRTLQVDPELGRANHAPAKKRPTLVKKTQGWVN